MTTNDATQKQDKKIEAIAEAKRYGCILGIAKNEIFGLHTLEARHNDDADFHTVAVWGLKAMLEKAYDAGYEESILIHERRSARS